MEMLINENKMFKKNYNNLDKNKDELLVELQLEKKSALEARTKADNDNLSFER